jgi:hypothetical protein
VIIPLNTELNPICHLLALLGSATIVVVSRLRVKLHRKTRHKIFKLYVSVRCLFCALEAELLVISDKASLQETYAILIWRSL